MSKLPIILRTAPRKAAALAVGLAAGFSLTMFAAGLAVSTGALRLAGVTLTERVDLAAALIFAPVCALIFAILFEVARAASRGKLEDPGPRVRPIRWSPGQREG